MVSELNFSVRALTSSLVLPATGSFHTCTVLHTVNCKHQTTGSLNKMSEQFAAVLKATKADFFFDETSGQFVAKQWAFETRCQDSL